MTALPEERLGQLRVAKLRALLGPQGDDVHELDAAAMGTGAALRRSDGRAAVLVEAATRRSLGGALTWALRRGADSLTLIVECDESVASHLAREASWFDVDIEVRRIAGTTSVPVEPAPLPPAPVGVPGDEFVPLLREAGVDVVLEHGVTKGEVLGLEVARVVEVDGSPTLEVGVGRFDREISSMMFSNIPTVDALAKAAAMVREYRRPGGTTHPLRDLVPERWLRRMLLDDPSLVGASQLRAVDTTIEPESLRESQPAALAGVGADGGAVVVVCTAGVDLDVVPLAADTRASVDPAAELLICGPERILVDATRAVGAALRMPARFVGLALPY
ncbi:MAG: hypothetical protein U0Q22_16590 [Acidimicrobiales bacterium]